MRTLHAETPATAACIQVVSKWLDYALVVATLVFLWLVSGVVVPDGAVATNFTVPRAREEACLACLASLSTRDACL